VQLVDISNADAPVAVLAEQTIRPAHQVPIPFELVYDRSRIDPTHRYAVQARITDDERLSFVSDREFPAITYGAPPVVEVVVRPVGGP
jgi:putative lipoprotein